MTLVEKLTEANLYYKYFKDKHTFAFAIRASTFTSIDPVSAHLDKQLNSNSIQM